MALFFLLQFVMPGNFSHCYLSLVHVWWFSHLVRSQLGKTADGNTFFIFLVWMTRHSPHGQQQPAWLWTLRETIPLHFLLSACPSLFYHHKIHAHGQACSLHILACCSVFLVLSLAVLCGGMLINPSLLDQTMPCFLMTSSILWPPSHVEKLPRKSQLWWASCLPGHHSSSICPDYLCDSENWWSGIGNDCIKSICIQILCQTLYGEVALIPARKQTEEFRGCALHPPSCTGLALVLCQTPTKATTSLSSAASQGRENITKGWDKDRERSPTK